MPSKIELDYLESKVLGIEAAQRNLQLNRAIYELFILIKSGAADDVVETKRNEIVMGFEANLDETIAALRRANDLGR